MLKNHSKQPFKGSDAPFKVGPGGRSRLLLSKHDHQDADHTGNIGSRRAGLIDDLQRLAGQLSAIAECMYRIKISAASSSGPFSITST